MPLDLPPIDLDSIQDDSTRLCIVALLNLVQNMAADIDTLRAQNQALRDENARLKGQPSRPVFPPPNDPPKPPLSSEKERKQPKNRTLPGTKATRIVIDREVTLAVVTVHRVTRDSA